MGLESDPRLHPNRAKRLQRRLIAAAFGKADFATARTLCRWLQGEEVQTGGEFHTTLWTALAVIYARPFTANGVGRLPKRFAEFDDEQHESHHRMLWAARNHTFAHTGVHPGHAAHVMPPGAFGENGCVTVGRIPYARETLPGIESLCDRQLAVAKEYVEELIHGLYGYREWAEGTMIQLDFPGVQFFRPPFSDAE